MDKPSPDYVEIRPPKEFHAPETAEGKDTFEIVDTWKVKGDKLCLVKLGEVSMPEKEAKEQKPTYKGMAQSIVNESNYESDSS